VIDNFAYPRELEFTSLTTLVEDESDYDRSESSANIGPSMSEEVSASLTIISNDISAADGEVTRSSAVVGAAPTSMMTSAAVGAEPTSMTSSAAVGPTIIFNGNDADEEYLYLYMGRSASFMCHYKVGCAENDELLKRRKKTMAQYFSVDLVFEAFPITIQRLQAIGINAIVTLEALAFSLIDQLALSTYGHRLRLNVRCHLKYKCAAV
jgi:hypothetical protein